jgi:hypothetical protein
VGRPRARLQPQVEEILEWLGRQRAFFLIVPAGLVAVVGYRLWRRRRHGTARAGELCGPPEPERKQNLAIGAPLQASSLL